MGAVEIASSGAEFFINGEIIRITKKNSTQGK